MVSKKMNPESVSKTEPTGTKLINVNLCNGKKGGVGKSTLARIMSELYHQLGREFTLVDADPNYDVARIYDNQTVAIWESSLVPKAGKLSRKAFLDNLEKNEVSESNEAEGIFSQQIVFSDAPRLRYLGKRFLELIDTCGQDIIVSLPANDNMEYFLDSNRINKALGQDSRKFNIVNWWCLPGCQNSQKMFLEFVEKYPNIKHVAVFNHGISTAVPDWSTFRPSPELLKALKEKRFTYTAITGLEAIPTIVAELDKNVPYREIIKGTKVDQFSREDLKEWLDDNITGLKETGYFEA